MVVAIQKPTSPTLGSATKRVPPTTHRPARLALADRRTIERIPIRRHVIDADNDNVAAAQLAVDRQVEQREIPFKPLYLQFGSDRPHMARPQWRLGADELALVPSRGVQASR